MTRILRGLGASLILTLLLIGAPIALVAWVGNPWPPGGWAEVQLVTNATIYGAVAVIAWAAWAQLVISFVVEAAAAVGGYQPRRLPLVSTGQQHFVRALVAAVATVGVSAATIGASTAAAVPAATAPTTEPTAERPHHTDRDAPSTPHVVTENATTLWQLAELHTGDGARWRDLLAANRGTQLPDGNRLAQGTQSIPAGTTLRLPPGTATPAASQQPNDGDPADTVRVERGDTLWDITEDHLGDPTRYPEVFKASRSTVQPGGDRLVDPDHIEPGWHITIPTPTAAADSAPSGRAKPAKRPPQPEKPSPSPHVPDKAEATQPPPHDKGTPAEAVNPSTPQPSRQQSEATPDQRNEKAASVTDAPTVDTSAGPVAPWVLPGLTGGGVALAGAMLLGLQALRRRQFRNRRPGRAIAAPDPVLAPVEKTISAAGGPAAAAVTWLDEALRRLAAAAHDNQLPMPPIAAVELHADIVTVHLSGAADLPDPWQGTPDRLHWHCTTTTPADELGPDTGWVEPPYPLLVTLGHTDQGHLWMLNCEELGTLTLTGATDRGRDLARHIAAQVAVNPWSRSVNVDCVGIAEETEQLSDQIRCHPPGAETTAMQEALATAVATVDRADRHDTDTSTARAGGIDEDVWPARMILIDAHTDTTPGHLDELLQLVNGQVGRTGTSIILTGDQPVHAASGVQVNVTPEGRARLERQQLDLIAVGLTADEAHGCGQLFAQSGNVEDIEVPIDESASDGWAANVDRAGALRREHTRPRTDEDQDDEPTRSLLELDDDEYSSIAPVTPEDLEALAPRVPGSVRAKVEADDPTLDEDLADWFNPDSDRPKLAVLGPVKVTAHGKPLATSKAYCVELLAYLATQDHRKFGVLRDQIADAFAIRDAAQVRKYVNMVRDWLGTNPRTGQPHLPDADKSPASKARGTYVYQVDHGLLVDQELFKRLRQRGMARGGAEGHRDLVQALQLVSGHPFDQLRPGGWSWLKDTGDEDHMITMVADTALTVVTRCLAEKNLDGARAAARISATAAPHEETTHMILACLTAAEGNTDEAARIVREEVYNRPDLDGPPPDIAERTRTIVKNQEWLAS